MGNTSSRPEVVQTPRTPRTSGMEVACRGTSGTLKQYLLRQLECPVCYQVRSGHVYQCLSGHSFCSECGPRLGNKCCLCQAGFSTRSRNYLAEELILNVAGGPCKNALEGCLEIVLPADMAKHLQACTFSHPCLMRWSQPPIESFLDGDMDQCTWRGAYRDLFDHVDTRHSGRAFREMAAPNIADVRLSSPHRVCDYTCMLEHRDHLFWCRLGIYHDLSLAKAVRLRRDLHVFVQARHVDGHLLRDSELPEYSCTFRFQASTFGKPTLEYESRCSSVPSKGHSMCSCVFETFINPTLNTLSCTILAFELDAVAPRNALNVIVEEPEIED